MHPHRLRINFFFRWFRLSPWTWAAAALTWAESEHTWAEGEHAWAIIPQEVGSRRIEAGDYAGEQLVSPEHGVSLAKREDIPEDGQV